ncbi:SET domain-containing protein [Leptospira wolffii]|uniref:SET domain-containing protein n=1 Tax=Leptospira wolffii TaxID=409998 RepID=A0A2M9ZDS7_9LEPT|nr:SET domain-containing protein-lysine N-methyltransferase [Leptospira wolffii]EPG65470.1 SET domain protein [Leptospira wolffii serovar Khorat str. Khorat-H2]PJZ66575.1 SET domain-containing protein-lysine N-methyltransferase [Leptospira wolffii]TGK61554.1 SET domain-containing protein [Leptospira wolffii]TGK70098.1 SET domain-containing protein [Leptospira wolffii]TGK77021.1 SET domain-containing protein [Leptospira wolffii]
MQVRSRVRSPKVFAEKDFEIKESKIPGIGMGLFPKQDLIKGDTVGYYTGRVLNDKSANSPKYCESKYLLWICKDHWIYGEGKESNYTRYINHSTKPNVKLVTSTRWKTARFEVLRKIKAGEELFFDYGDEYWIHVDISPLERN